MAGASRLVAFDLGVNQTLEGDRVVVRAFVGKLFFLWVNFS
jgi:hypothetical protein